MVTGICIGTLLGIKLRRARKEEQAFKTITTPEQFADTRVYPIQENNLPSRCSFCTKAVHVIVTKIKMNVN